MDAEGLNESASARRSIAGLRKRCPLKRAAPNAYFRALERAS